MSSVGLGGISSISVEENVEVYHKGSLQRADLRVMPQDIARMKRVVSEGVRFSFPICSEEIPDGGHVIHGITKNFHISSGNLSKADLRLCLFELAVAGIESELLLPYLPVQSSEGSSAVLSHSAIEAVRDAAVHSEHDVVFHRPFWWTIPFDTDGIECRSDIHDLHRVYLLARLVGSSSYSCALYSHLLSACTLHVDSLEFDVCNVHGAHVVVDDFLSVMTGFLGSPLPEEIDYNMWYAALADSASLPKDMARSRQVLAMIGDFVLKVSTAENAFSNSAQPLELSDELSNGHSNSAFSTLFAGSAFSEFVILTPNVKLSSKRVGSTFLEAVAGALYMHGGMKLVSLYSQNMGIRKFD